MDDGRLANEMTLEGIANQLKDIRTAVGSLDGKVTALDGKFVALDGKVTALDGKVAVLDSKVEALDGKVGAVESSVGALDGKVGSLETGFSSLRHDLAAFDAKMTEGFTEVNRELNNAKIRDEQAHELLKFSLEARESLRETMETRFDEAAEKQDQEIALLKDVLGDGSRRHPRRPRRRQ